MVVGGGRLPLTADPIAIGSDKYRNIACLSGGEALSVVNSCFYYHFVNTKLHPVECTLFFIPFIVKE
jgi:hypothetical protein